MHAMQIISASHAAVAAIGAGVKENDIYPLHHDLPVSVGESGLFEAAGNTKKLYFVYESALDLVVAFAAASSETICVDAQSLARMVSYKELCDGLPSFSHTYIRVSYYPSTRIFL